MCPFNGQPVRDKYGGYLMSKVGMDASPRWHSWVASHPVGGLAVTGLVATQIVTYLGYCFKAIGLPTLPWPAYNGALIGGADTWGSPLAQYWAGQSMHYVNGIVFTILFGMVARAKLPGSHVIKGVLYGVVLAIVSVGFLVPYAYVPKMGYGLFLMDGPDGWKLPAGVMLWHVIWGFLIGTLYQPKDNN